MRESYKKDRCHSYLILEMEENFQESEYSIKMITYNQIPGLLKCEIRKMNGSISLYYDTTSKQSIAQIFERSSIQYEDIRQFLKGIRKGLESAAGYLLDENDFLLDSAHLYMDGESKEVFLCYVPGRRGNFQKEFQNFTEYILKKLDHSQEEAVMLGYELYRQAMQERESIDQIMQLAYREIHPRKEEKKKTKNKSSTEEKKENFKKITAEKEQKRQWQMDNAKWKKWGIYVGGTLGIVCLIGGSMTLAVYLRWDLTKFGGILAVFLAISAYTVSFLKNKKEQKKKERQSGRRIVTYEGEKKQKDVNLIENETEEETELLPFGETVVLESKKKEKIYELISQDKEKGPDIKINQTRLIIGKMRHYADIILEEEHISRVHARIEQNGEDVYLMDLNSTNGTFVNGERLETNERRRLYQNDEVVFGGMIYRFDIS